MNFIQTPAQHNLKFSQKKSLQLFCKEVLKIGNLLPKNENMKKFWELCYNITFEML